MSNMYIRHKVRLEFVNQVHVQFFEITLCGPQYVCMGIHPQSFSYIREMNTTSFYPMKWL